MRPEHHAILDFAARVELFILRVVVKEGGWRENLGSGQPFSTGQILIGNLSADGVDERTSGLGEDESEKIHSGYSTTIIQTCVTSNCHRYPH